METLSPQKFVITLLVLFTTLTLFQSSSLAARILNSKRSTEFIEMSCSSTAYPKLCLTSLSAHASTIQTSPELMARTALNITLSSAKSTSKTMLKLLNSHGLTQREVNAMKDCVEELSDSVDELRKSICRMIEIEGSDFQLKMNDIQTWVSAALTAENTCTDGFEGKVMNGNVKTIVKTRILKIAHLTSNALALINRYASIHG